ncbi:hypothetical protein [Chitinophaga sp. LS1]|uniref:hypothetical protein n=1 Tax=Chitinophaga sp. LS1 TaxID=3051176 RepID=UPI002AAC4166|nr:hypothetical protein [Chitinophaga sp. LS1]WPV67047.1 hypothetical protein QQL36_35230 [Chitinophaga sp. LS1]
MESVTKAKPLTSVIRTILKWLAWPFIRLWKLLQRGYWMAEYRLKHQIRIKEFVVIDFRVVIIIGFAITAAYFLWYQKPLYLTIPSLATELYIVENTLRTVSIFVGIVFSFIVLSFNVFYKYFGRLTFLRFFTSRQIKYIFTLFICDMVLLLYTSGYLKEGSARNSYGDSLFIISLLVSVVLVLSIIPTLILLLRSSQNRNNIKELIRDFNVDWSLSYHMNVLWEHGDKNSHYQRDPITLLIEIGTAAIKDFDRTSLWAIKDGCLAHLNRIHEDYKKEKKFHPNAFYEKLDDLLRPLFNVAIKERNETAALMIVNMYYEVENFYVKNFADFNIYQSTEHHYDGIRFIVVMSQFLAKSLQFNEDTVSERVINVLREWWDDIVIKVYLPAIQYDYPKDERFPTDKTSFFLSSTYYQLAITFDLVFTYKKMSLYKEISKFYSVTNLSILSSENTRNTKVYLLQINGNNAQTQFEKFLPKLDLDIASEIYPFGSLAIDQEMDYIRSLVPFHYEMRGVDFLFRNNKLNAYIINDIKAIAYHAMHKFNEHTVYKNALKAIIEKFDYLRSLISQSATDYQKEIYILLERYLSYIQEWLPEYKVRDKEIVQLIADTLKKFSFKGQFTEELEGKGYLVRDVR